MPVIPPNLDPQRFQFLNPLVLGEFSTSGNLGWRNAIDQILGYYQSQKPFDESFLDFSELSEIIIEAWKENLLQELVENSAEELAELVLQTLIVVTGETVPGYEPPDIPDTSEDLPDVEPVEPTPGEEPDRETFPPVVTPREPQTSTGREPSNEAPSPPETPSQQPRPAREPGTRRQPSPSRNEPPIFTTPVLPVPRQTGAEGTRDELPQSDQDDQEEPPRDEEPVSPEETPGDGNEAPVSGEIGIDYAALENAIFNALRRWYDYSLMNPSTITVQTVEPDEVNPADLIPEIIDQIDVFKEAGKVYAANNAEINDVQSTRIFTLPGEI